MKLWRCENENCDSFQKHFEGDTQECPACGACISQELMPVHYLVPADGPIKTGLGGRMVACDPKRKTIPQSSGERAAVTCPKCIASDIFKDDERDGVNNHVKYFEKIAAGTRTA